MTLPPEDRDLPPRPPLSPDPILPPEPPAPPAARLPHTRIGAAWFGVWAGAVVVILLIVFVGQNTAPLDVQFLWLDGQIPTALALLIAGVGGAIVAMAIAAARILQLRRAVRRVPHA